eukprot:6673517-Pyramimonas_sp.AAC.2
MRCRAVTEERDARETVSLPCEEAVMLRACISCDPSASMCRNSLQGYSHGRVFCCLHQHSTDCMMEFVMVMLLSWNQKGPALCVCDILRACREDAVCTTGHGSFQKFTGLHGNSMRTHWNS